MSENAAHIPTCSVERACGACQHLAVPYAQQLARKDARIAELFAEFVIPAGTPAPAAASAPAAAADILLPIIGMDEPFHYRNKVASPFAPGKRIAPRAGRGGRDQHGDRDRVRGAGKKASRAAASEHEILCGMYAAGTHRIVATDGCLIENAEAKRIILSIRSLMPRFGIQPYREDANTGFLRHAVVRVGHTSGEILVTLVTNGRQFPASRAFCRELVRRHPGITTVVQNVNERQTNVIFGEREQTLYGPGFILDRLCGLSFRISSQSFYQVNAVQTEVLYERAIKLARLDGTQHAIDAYCGTGTIGLVTAKRGAARVVGVDTTASAIRDARTNARHNGIENAEFAVGDAGDFMRQAAGRGERVDVLLMDPPRAGASEDFIAAAGELAPGRIVYISCNPQTQVRDVRALAERGYRVEAVQPVDMFPHTDHIECIVALAANGRNGGQARRTDG